MPPRCSRSDATLPAPMRESREGATLVGARLPLLEVRRRPEAVLGETPRPVEAHGVRAALLRLLLVNIVAAARWAAAADVTPATAPIYAWRGEVLRPAARNCGGGAEKGRGKRRGRDRFWTRIDPINRYISRPMRAGWGRLKPRWGPVGRCDELPDMLLACAAPIYAWRGEVLRPAARNCGGGAEKGRGKRRGRDRFWTRIDPIERYISRSMLAGWGRLKPRWGAVGRCGVCYARKLAPNPQIGSGGAMRAEIGDLLELLLPSY
jgi:hypothetical protein